MWCCVIKWINNSVMVSCLELRNIHIYHLTSHFNLLRVRIEEDLFVQHLSFRVEAAENQPRHSFTTRDAAEEVSFILLFHTAHDESRQLVFTVRDWLLNCRWVKNQTLEQYWARVTKAVSLWLIMNCFALMSLLLCIVRRFFCSILPIFLILDMKPSSCCSVSVGTVLFF